MLYERICPDRSLDNWFKCFPFLDDTDEIELLGYDDDLDSNISIDSDLEREILQELEQEVAKENAASWFPQGVLFRMFYRYISLPCSF